MKAWKWYFYMMIGAGLVDLSILFDHASGVVCGVFDELTSETKFLRLLLHN